ncbi:hypothetical protein HZS_6491, partial [Henneguya salminicola]
MENTDKLLDNDIFKKKIKSIFSWLIYFLQKTDTCPDIEMIQKFYQSLNDNSWVIDDSLSQFLISGHFYNNLLISYHSQFDKPLKILLSSSNDIFVKFLTVFSIDANIEQLISESPINIPDHIELLEKFIRIISQTFAPNYSLHATLQRLTQNEYNGKVDNHCTLLSQWIKSINDWVKKDSSLNNISSLCNIISDGFSILSLLIYYIPTTSQNEGLVYERTNISDCINVKLNNIELFQKICSNYLTKSVLSLSQHDFLDNSFVLEPLFEVIFSEIFSIVEENITNNDETMFYSILNNHSVKEIETDDNFHEDDLELPQNLHVSITSQITDTAPKDTSE